MTHWKKLTNPDYLGAYALEDGKDIVLTISMVRNEMVIGSDGKREECVVAHFAEKVKPMILNATNMKMIASVYKTPYIEQWQGKRIRIGIQRVKAFGEVVDALRVRNEIPGEEIKPIFCEECKSEITPFGGRSAKALAEYTKGKFGKALCSACATKFAEEAKKAAESAQISHETESGTAEPTALEVTTTEATESEGDNE